MIRKGVFLTPVILRECRRIIAESEIMKEDDNNWPEPDRVGRQELEIVMGNEHISFTASEIGSLVDVQKLPQATRPPYLGQQYSNSHRDQRNSRPASTAAEDDAATKKSAATENPSQK
ncbi:hypothetical protein Nepgr_024703 [Nepenthes gracilis]|uniref:Uncharacterized protein n=1 Tax=Nepenthes gracilis TaxID=150966 RepID=A0AAD3Y0B5_NEPGR|nr:hypothetical protein Nepgr_024703 [Nepenthes gracilis]